MDEPVQTGVLAQGPGDATVERSARRLGTGPGSVTVEQGQRLAEPMAPRPAAALDGVDLLPLEVHAERIAGLARAHAHDHVLVEGSGGLLVELDGARRTLADLELLLRERVGADGGVVVRAALGTLNRPGLTLEALAVRGFPVLGSVIGSWPSVPGPVEHGNRQHLAGLSVPLLGELPAGLGCLRPLDPDVLECRALAAPFRSSSGRAHHVCTRCTAQEGRRKR